ncbi:MAG: histidine kinase [Azoarcus sp.]|nr:histidine kinase [Azoarcus sp.]
MKNRLIAALARRSILLLVGLAMVMMTLIGLGGMSASVVVAETVQGSASAINVAGSLRRLTHRIASVVVADVLEDKVPSARVVEAVRMFEEQLANPALLRVLERTPDGLFAATHRGAEATWRLSLKPMIETINSNGPPPSREGVAALLLEVDTYVEQLNTLVAVLEHDTEARIQDLRRILAIAIAMTLVVAALALVLLHRLLHRPLNDLLRSANRIAEGNFAARVAYTGRNELGQVGAAFNLMATELSKLYRDLENRVEAKTAELQRSNRALELLYHAIARLYQTPTAAEAYEETLRDIEQVAGLKGSLACIEPRHDGPAMVIASTLGPCPDRASTALDAALACAQCRGDAAPWTYQSEGDHDLLRVPLRDTERHYGMLRLVLVRGQRLEGWQRQLVEALSRHIGMALGAARRSEQERLLGLQEERSVIARELHDSLAQALSYMKIQVSLLQPLVGDPARSADALATLADLREGVNAAYRQLRELLVSFRLKMTGDFPDLLQSAVEEYASKGKVELRLETRLADCPLSPNQEVHVLHIIREALSNMVRHAQAAHAWLRLTCEPGGELTVVVEDDGLGLGEVPADAHNHHGLAIMRERARSLGGTLDVGSRPGGGTRVVLRFPAGARTVAAEPILFGGAA